jgi:hypothetical protein
MVMGVVETIIAIAAAVVVANFLRGPNKQTAKILGPVPMKPRPVQTDMTADQARQLVIAGLMTISEHGGWRINHQETHALAAEMEYWQAIGGRYGSDRRRMTLQFHAQLRSIGKQTEVSWQYEKESLALSMSPRESPGAFDLSDSLFDRTNTAILNKLRLL